MWWPWGEWEGSCIPNETIGARGGGGVEPQFSLQPYKQTLVGGCAHMARNDITPGFVGSLGERDRVKMAENHRSQTDCWQWDHRMKRKPQSQRSSKYWHTQQ